MFGSILIYESWSVSGVLAMFGGTERNLTRVWVEMRLRLACLKGPTNLASNLVLTAMEGTNTLNETTKLSVIFHAWFT